MCPLFSSTWQGNAGRDRHLLFVHRLRPANSTSDIPVCVGEDRRLSHATPSGGSVCLDPVLEDGLPVRWGGPGAPCWGSRGEDHWPIRSEADQRLCGPGAPASGDHEGLAYSPARMRSNSVLALGTKSRKRSSFSHAYWSQ
jgi:hypothetical protein